MLKKRYLKKNDSFEGKFLPIFLLVFFFLIIGFLVFSNYRITKKRTELQAQIENLKSQIRELEEKKAKLQSAISNSNNPEFLEKEARDKLGLKKPGEEVMVVWPSKKEEGFTTVERKNFWQIFLEKIGF